MINMSTKLTKKLQSCKAFPMTHGALSSCVDAYRALSRMYRALSRMYRALFMIHGAFQTCVDAASSCEACGEIRIQNTFS